MSRKEHPPHTVLLLGTASCVLVGALTYVYYSYWTKHNLQWRHLKGAWPQIKGYRLEKYLDYGATCKVFSAVDEASGRRVALKVMYKPDLSSDQLEGVKSEITAMQTLDYHPNIVRLHNTIQTDEFYVLVMDYASGGELFRALARRVDTCVHGRGFPEERAKDIAAQMISAIMYVHSKGIIHRDMKLENVLLSTDAEDSPIQICDFGMAKVVQRAEGQPLSAEMLVAHSKVGSDGYLSPAVNTGNYDFKVDYWSFGIMMFMLLCGYPPTESPKDVSNPHAFNKEELRLELAKQGWRHVSAQAKDFVETVLFPSDQYPDNALELGHAMHASSCTSYADNLVGDALGTASVTKWGAQLRLHPWFTLDSSSSALDSDSDSASSEEECE